ncbi:MAG: peptidoglycan editing factor PgeF [Prevotella sp.]|nr:peptidoglycan editing factor PgeF [Prevotella sp.]
MKNSQPNPPYQQFWNFRFDRHVHVISTTRKGGYSVGEYGDFNINPWVGDDPEAVAANRLLLAQELKLRDVQHIVMPHQVHGSEIRQIDRSYLSLEPKEQEQLLEGIDAVMTDVPSLAIGVSTADCLPIILYDPEHHAACAVHAGWRGTLQRIVQKAFKAMRGAYGTKPDKLKVFFGACIRMHHYPVGAEVIEQFQQAGFDTKYFSMPVVVDKPNGEEPDKEPKWYFDLSNCNEFQLLDLGIRSRRIMNSMLSTFDSDEFFSVRRQGPCCGRTFTAIIL